MSNDVRVTVIDIPQDVEFKSERNHKGNAEVRALVSAFIADTQGAAGRQTALACDNTDEAKKDMVAKYRQSFNAALAPFGNRIGGAFKAAHTAPNGVEYPNMYVWKIEAGLPVSRPRKAKVVGTPDGKVKTVSTPKVGDTKPSK